MDRFMGNFPQMMLRGFHRHVENIKVKVRVI